MYGAASSMENHYLKTCYKIVSKITTISLSLNIKIYLVLFVALQLNCHHTSPSAAEHSDLR